jgi:hypothetical protein
MARLFKRHANRIDDAAVHHPLIGDAFLEARVFGADSFKLGNHHLAGQPPEFTFAGWHVGSINFQNPRRRDRFAKPPEGSGVHTIIERPAD